MIRAEFGAGRRSPHPSGAAQLIHLIEPVPCECEPLVVRYVFDIAIELALYSVGSQKSCYSSRSQNDPRAYRFAAGGRWRQHQDPQYGTRGERADCWMLADSPR